MITKAKLTTRLGDGIYTVQEATGEPECKFHTFVLKDHPWIIYISEFSNGDLIGSIHKINSKKQFNFAEMPLNDLCAKMKERLSK